MGADLLIASLVVERDRSLDFEAGRAAIDRLTPEDILEPDLYFDEDPQTGAGLGAIRERLRAELDELRLGLSHSREIDRLEVRGALVYVTGGMSYGDSPTELFATIDRLRAASGVLAAVGFENEA